MMVFENSPSDHETRFIWCPVEFTSILHSHTQLVPRAYCEANLDWLHLFHQWECLNCIGLGLSISCVKWPSACYLYHNQGLGISEMSSLSPHRHSCKKVMDIVLSTISTSRRKYIASKEALYIYAHFYAKHYTKLMMHINFKVL